MKLSHILGFVGILALFAAPTFATCSANCPAPVGCYGGCTVSAPSSCIEMCWANCTGYTCRIQGPGGCQGGVDAPCDEDFPIPILELGDRPWAVLEFPLASYESGRIKTLAASSADFAEAATRTYAEKRARHERIDGEALGTATILVPGPANAHAVDLEVRSFHFGSEVLDDMIFYVRALANEKGVITKAETLYANRPDAKGAMMSFLGDNVRIRLREPVSYSEIEVLMSVSASSLSQEAAVISSSALIRE